MTEQLTLPGLYVGSAMRSEAARATRLLGLKPWWCTACDFEGEHTPEQCSAMRPTCHRPGCDRPTCIQARANGYVPTCLEHFFDRALWDLIPREGEGEP